MKRIIIALMLILISFSTLFRGLYFSYEAYGFLAALALLSSLYFICKIRDGEPVRFNRLFLAVGLGLVAATALSFVNAANPRENFGTLLLHGELLVVFTVLYDYFYERKQEYTRYLMLPVAAAGFVCAVAGLLGLTGEFKFLDVTVFYGRIGSTFQYANTAAIYFVICLVFSITIANTEKNVILRSVAAGLGSIFMYAFFMTGSRGGYLVTMFIIPLFLLAMPSARWINSVILLISAALPVFITLGSFNRAISQHSVPGTVAILAVTLAAAVVLHLILSIFYRAIAKDRELTAPKGTRLVLAGVFVACLALSFVFREELVKLLPDIMAKRVSNLIKAGFNDINIQIRLHYNLDALKLISANWLTGLGGGGWKAMYQSVQDYSYIANFVHNHYFQVFVENGILGFLSFCAMAIISVAGCIISLLRSGSTTEKAYTAGLLCALVSLVVHSAGDFDLSFISLLLLLFAMYAAAMTCTARNDTDKEHNGRPVKSKIPAMALVISCSVLFCFNAMFFAGAHNENEGFKHMQKVDYRTAAAYYEEAHRLDRYNAAYSFELARIYHYFARVSKSDDISRSWFEKAIEAGERSVAGNKNYPAYMKTLVKIYIDSGRPLQALELARKLAVCQKYNSETYELLAASLIEAARYYQANSDIETARELLEMCIELDQNPYLRRSLITKPFDIGSEKKIAGYKHSIKMEQYMETAKAMLEGL
jgi:hypothetical protein